jgi:hypothetical protein
MPHYSVKGDTVTNELINQLYALRLSIVQLKPTIDAQQDFVLFSSFIKNAQCVDYIIEDEQVQAFSATHYAPQNIAGKTAIVVEPEFVFVNPQYRKGNFTQLSFSQLIRRLKLKYWYTPIYTLGCAYPHSFVAFVRYFHENVWTLNDPNISDYHKQILVNFLQRKMGKVDIGNGIVEVPTLHHEQSPDHIARLQKNEHYAAYVQQNPNWAQGYTLGFITKISWWSLIKGILRGKAKPKGKLSANQSY